MARALAFVQRSWLAIALFAIAGVLLVSAAKGERGMERVLQLQGEVDEANDRNFRLVQQISALRRDLEMARSDDATLERLARRYLSMVRPGEVLYHVPPARDAAKDGDDDAAVVPGPTQHTDDPARGARPSASAPGEQARRGPAAWRSGPGPRSATTGGAAVDLARSGDGTGSRTKSPGGTSQDPAPGR